MKCLLGVVRNGDVVGVCDQGPASVQVRVYTLVRVWFDVIALLVPSDWGKVVQVPGTVIPLLTGEASAVWRPFHRRR